MNDEDKTMAKKQMTDAVWELIRKDTILTRSETVEVLIGLAISVRRGSFGWEKD